MEEILSAAAFLEQNDDFLLFTHVSPDGDTIGSCLALCASLKTMGKHAAVVSSEPIPKNLTFLPGAKDVLSPDKAEPARNGIAVDCADAERIGKSLPLFRAAEHTLCIDHHGTNPRYADVNFVENVAATGELIYRILNRMSISVTKEIASCLYTAIATDTGNFAYTNTTPDSFLIASEIMKTGFPLAEINRQLFRTEAECKVRLRGRFIENMTVAAEGLVAVSKLRYADFTAVGATSEHAEGFVDVLRDIDTVEAAAALRETAEGLVRVSMRGKCYADVSSVAVRHGGGGHVLSAGCTLSVPIDEAEKMILSELVALVDGAKS